MAIEYFCAYNDYLDSFGPLSDADFGRLMRAAIRYNATGELPELSGRVKLALAVIRAQIDRDRKRYDERCEKNRESALKRWDNGTECERMRTDANDANRKTNNKTNRKTKSVYSARKHEVYRDQRSDAEATEQLLRDLENGAIL